MQLGKLWLKTLRFFHLISENDYRRGKIRYLPHIDKISVQKEINSFKGRGVTTSERSPKLIVTLTSFPQRMYDIHFTLYSLLNQSLKPDAVLLWLSEEEFPNREKDVPNAVLKLQENGLTIKWVKENLRSYKKLIPALKEYKNDILVTADDDIYYPQT